MSLLVPMNHLLLLQFQSVLILLLGFAQASVFVPNKLVLGEIEGLVKGVDKNIILNPTFEDGLNNWTARKCKIELHESMENGKILPQSGKVFASATERTSNWNGIEQEVTGRVQRGISYEVNALVRIYSINVTTANVQITLWIQHPDSREEYIVIAKSQATGQEWIQLQGEFLLNDSPSVAIIYLEGPPPGTDILINSLFVKPAGRIPHSARPIFEKSLFGVNVIENSNLHDGTNGWFPLGNCSLSVENGSPHELPSMAKDSLGPHESLSGRYILVTNRTDSQMGPAQMITDKLRPYLTYQVSAWVRSGSAASGPQVVRVGLVLDGQWTSEVEIETSDGTWQEIGGSFRIEKQPSQAMASVRGPSSGIDLMVAGLQIFPVNRRARFSHLKQQTDKIRKRDIILKFLGSGNRSTPGNSVQVKQIQNSFPLGSCVTRTIMDNEKFVNFLSKHFNWVVFGNELKWFWTEPQEGKFNYFDADALVNMSKILNMEMRGHCIFWEVENTIQSWVRSLNESGLETAVQNRLTDLLKRYKGKFRHFDVDNEMLHGSFYQDRLGKDIRANMFKIAHELDPSATLFVNDYNIEDGSDYRSTPEKYIQQILELQKQGAPVGGIGIQGHNKVPVGPVVCSALDKLGTLGLPIWFTELDVSSANEYIRADDLEVMLREVYAHPAVEGIMLWGFWELYMSRKNAHLVNSDGKINQAGKRFLALKNEWLSRANGRISDLGEFRFRGFHGTYNVQIIYSSETVEKTFVVEPGDEPLVLSIDLKSHISICYSSHGCRLSVL